MIEKYKRLKLNILHIYIYMLFWGFKYAIFLRAADTKGHLTFSSADWVIPQGEKLSPLHIK